MTSCVMRTTRSLFVPAVRWERPTPPLARHPSQEGNRKESPPGRGGPELVEGPGWVSFCIAHNEVGYVIPESVHQRAD